MIESSRNLVSALVKFAALASYHSAPTILFSTQDDTHRDPSKDLVKWIRSTVGKNRRPGYFALDNATSSDRLCLYGSLVNNEVKDVCH